MMKGLLIAVACVLGTIIAAQTSQLHRLGFSQKGLQSRVGQPSLDVTFGTYTHAFPEDDRRAADSFADMLYRTAEGASESARLKLVG